MLKSFASLSNAVQIRVLYITSSQSAVVAGCCTKNVHGWLVSCQSSDVRDSAINEPSELKSKDR
jgi:translation initiation factor 6 (eIF-6)